MSWLLTWFFFFPTKQKRTFESLSSHTETKGGLECYDSDLPCVSSCHAALRFYSVAIPVCGREGASCKVVSSQSFRWGTALFLPLHLLVCPPLPSRCQVPVYCLSSPNLFFFALLCDVGSGLCKHFSFASWLNVRLCQ